MMLAAMVLIIFNVFFWTLFEQAGSSLTLFADRNTDLICSACSHLRGADPELQRALIVLFAPFISILWTRLAKRGLEPPIPVKFAIALIGVGVGFLFLVWGAIRRAPISGRATGGSPGSISIHSIAELCISPVGLSMITKLSIARIVGMMMGVWFLSISVAQYVAGVVAQFASVETVGGQVTNLKVSLDTYTVDVHDHRLDRDRRGRGAVPAVLAAQEVDARCQIERLARGACRGRSGCCRAAPRSSPSPSAAPPIRDQRGPLSVDLRPLSRRADADPRRDGVRRRGRRIDDGTVVLRRRRDQGGRRARARRRPTARS